LIKVMKFGGTSLGSSDALKRVVEIVRSDPADKVIVVSAMSGVTNSLIAWLEQGQPGVTEMIEDLRRKHLETVSPLIDGMLLREYEERIDESLDHLHEIMEHVIDRETEEVIKDTISSWGERLSSLSLTYLLRGAGIQAVCLTAEDAGIVARGTPGFGTADLEETAVNLRKRMVPLLREGRTPVITGYYGCDAAGRPHTFGRGGSDYSASVIAYGLDADVLEIWTDVDGFMTSDPRIVRDARTISEMDYGEAAELAYFGAKVLHPRTMEPVRKKGIRVVVKNTFNPGGSGTTIGNLRKAGRSLLRSVAVRTDLSIVKIYSSEIVYDPGLVCKIITAISGNGVTTYAISTSLSTLAIVIPAEAAKEAVASLEALSESKIEEVKVRDDVSLICAVGDNMLETSGVAASVFNAVDAAGANLELISEGASDVALNFVVPSQTAPNVVKKLHDMFIGD